MINYAVKLSMLTYDPTQADSVAQFTATMDRLKYAVPLTILVDITPVLMYNLLPVLHYMFSTTTTVTLLLMVPALLPHPVQGMAHHPTNVSTAISQTEEVQFRAADCHGLVKQPRVNA